MQITFDLSMIAPERKPVLSKLGHDAIDLICSRLVVDGALNPIEVIVFSTMLHDALQDTVTDMLTAQLARALCGGN